MLIWVLAVLFVLILIDLNRPHRKVDRLLEHHTREETPSNEEIEQLLEMEN